MSHWRHFFATILTGGLWLIPWIAVCIEATIRPWRCEVCDCHRPVLPAPETKPLQSTEPRGQDGESSEKVA